VRLTGAGQLLVRHTEVILNRLAIAEADLEDLLDVRRGHLRLGAFPSAFVDLVSRALARFGTRHPNVEVSLSAVTLEHAVRRLEDGELDLAVTFEYDLGPSPTREAPPRVHLLDDPMYLVLGRDHPLARRPELALEDLHDERWVLFTHGGAASKLLHRAFSGAGYEPRVALETDDLLAVQGLVAAAVGITLVPGMALPALRRDLEVRALGPSLPLRQVFALWPTSGLSPSAEAMLAVLGDEARGLRAQLHPDGRSA
jgi:DNA-binding transcriptional LysR family regulator